MQLHLLAFGKLKTPGLRNAADHYRKMLKTWATLDEAELKPLTVPDLSTSTREKIQQKEAELLESRFRSFSTRQKIYLLDERGAQLSTQEWTSLLRKNQDESIPDLIFCIGSSLGFHEKIRKKAHQILSLGPQTLSHELTRVVLLEQLFRAWSVLAGHPYHREG